MDEQETEATRQKYIEAMAPLFLPADPVSNDIIKYFASLLRIVGMEDKGWDPYLESRARRSRVLQFARPSVVEQLGCETRVYEFERADE